MWRQKAWKAIIYFFSNLDFLFFERKEIGSKFFFQEESKVCDNSGVVSRA